MDSFKLYVKGVEGSTVNVMVKASDNIESVKNKLKDMVKLPPSKFSLYYNENALEDKNTLSYYDIKEQDTINLVKEGEKKVNIITLGAGAVGKTSILKRFESGKFRLTTNRTIGIDFLIKKVRIDNEEVKLKLWDTAGQEKHFSVANSFYKKCKGALVVFDVNEAESFSTIEKWINIIKENADSSIIVYLIGNKIDLPDREVTTEEAMKLSKMYKIPYYETSAKTGANINDVLLSLAKEICSKHYKSMKGNGIELKVNALEANKKRNCCK